MEPIYETSEIIVLHENKTSPELHWKAIGQLCHDGKVAFLALTFKRNPNSFDVYIPYNYCEDISSDVFGILDWAKFICEVLDNPPDLKGMKFPLAKERI